MEPQVFGEVYWIKFVVEDQILRIGFLPVQDGGIPHILPLARLHQVKSLTSGQVWAVLGKVTLHDHIPADMIGVDSDGLAPEYCLEFPTKGDKTFERGYPRLEFILK